MSQRQAKGFMPSIAGLVALVATTANAAGRLEATLTNVVTDPIPTEVRVLVKLSNTGDQPIFVYRPETPFGRLDDQTAADVFVVRNSNVEQARFIGGRDYWGSPRLSHFLVIKPGESMEKELDLTHTYDYGNGGVFSVRYSISMDRAPDPYAASEAERAAFTPSVQDRVESNAVTIVAPHVVREHLSAIETCQGRPRRLHAQTPHHPQRDASRQHALAGSCRGLRAWVKKTVAPTSEWTLSALSIAGRAVLPGDLHAVAEEAAGGGFAFG